MASEEKPVEMQKQDSCNRFQNTNSPLRKTYFRLRQIKQATTTPAKIIAISSPKKYSDFYSHQQAIIQQLKPKDKKMSSTTSNFYSNLSNLAKNTSIQQKISSPLRNTFYNSKNNHSSPPRPPSSGSLILARTSLNFHKQDIFKDENNNNYLNKYKILKELGKGSFSTVFLARKQQMPKYKERCISPLKLNPQVQSIEVNNDDLEKSVNSPLLMKNQSLNSKSIQQSENNSFTNRGIQMKQTQEDNAEDQQKLVAIKVYQKFKMGKDPHKFKNIKKQINILQHIDHQNVLKLYQSVQTLTKISLVVEYGGDESLLQYVKKNYPLPIQTVRSISFQLIKSISYLHEKSIVHRDIKLQNILIHKDKIKLIDFGFSCLTHKQQKLTVICGTPNYMAPEVISRKQYIGQQADIWSFGVVVYALAQGRHPFKAETYNELERLVNRGKFEFKKVKDQPFMDFVKRILKVKGSDRPAAKDILEMRWLKKNDF